MVLRHLRGVRHTPPRQHPVAYPWRTRDGQFQPGPVIQPRSLTARPGGETDPLIRRHGGEQGLDAHLLPGGPDGIRGRDPQDISEIVLLTPSAYIGRFIDAIGDDPAGQHSRLPGAGQHLLPEFGFGGKGCRGGNVRLLAAGGIGDPLLREV
jgi:hypothetical protein